MKEIEEIYGEMLAVFARQVGFTPEDSCDLSARLYALAAQVQALLIQADWVLEQSFPQTAAGRYLDYHAQSRGITRRPAVKARGTLRFLADSPLASDVTIEAGTVCMTGENVHFVTTEAVVLAAGENSADAPAEAAEAGSGGNAGAGTVAWMAAMPAGVTRCTNPSPFQGGADEEDDETLRGRILETYRRLPNGANAAYYQTEAMACEGVAAATVVPRARGRGTVDVYVAGDAGLPGEDVLQAVGSRLAAMREIAVDVQVLAPTASEVPVEAEVQVEEGRDFEAVQARVAAALAGLFSGALLGKGMTMARLGQTIYAVEGVTNYRLFSPTADLAADPVVLPTLGAVTLRAMGA